MSIADLARSRAEVPPAAGTRPAAGAAASLDLCGQTVTERPRRRTPGVGKWIALFGAVALAFGAGLLVSPDDEGAAAPVTTTEVDSITPATTDADSIAPPTTVADSSTPATTETPETILPLETTDAGEVQIFVPDGQLVAFDAVADDPAPRLSQSDDPPHVITQLRDADGVYWRIVSGRLRTSTSERELGVPFFADQRSLVSMVMVGDAVWAVNADATELLEIDRRTVFLELGQRTEGPTSHRIEREENSEETRPTIPNSPDVGGGAPGEEGSG